MRRTSFILTLFMAAAWPAPGAEIPMEYFKSETKAISSACLADVHSLDDWKARRDALREQAAEMLDLDPMPPRTDLKPVVTGIIERDTFTVEKLYFQSMPHLYVTANLYLPKGLTKPAPTILYLCGHSPVVTNGVRCGNKAAYQRHGIWFARNGYVCLVIDTLDHGEIAGLHHGTYSENQWWWNSRGYTPAAVETWDAIRALDYLETRPEADTNRIGVTGRSGGGAYTWFLSALDDRVKVMAPVSGITDLQNYVVDGAVDGHCDCMFVVNTHRWDYPQLAALCAPRPLLLVNCDADSLFPLDGVVRLRDKVKHIYDLYGASSNFGLTIAPGGHHDTQDVQIPVFRWFNQHLKHEDPIIDIAATNEFSPLELKVFKEIPADELNTTIQNLMGPGSASASPASAAEWQRMRDLWMSGLREKVFSGWPARAPGPDLKRVNSTNSGASLLEWYSFESQPGIRLTLKVDRALSALRPASLVVQLSSPTRGGVITNSVNPTDSIAQATLDVRSMDLPEGISHQIDDTHLRRRYMLLGQTLDGMRVWDIVQALRAIRAMPDLSHARITVKADGAMGVNALYASLFEPVDALDISGIPSSQLNGPDYLNVLKILDLPQAVAMAAARCHVRLQSSDASGWNFLADLKKSGAAKLDLDFYR